MSTTGLTATIGQNPLNGTVALNSDGSFTYTPNPGFWGLDFFRYRASKDGYQSVMATAYVVVDTIAIEFGAQTSQGTQWQDLTTVTPTVWVGQLVRLRAVPKGLLPDVPIASRQWTADAKVVAGYQVINEGDQAIVLPFGETESRAEVARFYWVNGGMKNVTVAVKRAGSDIATEKNGRINVRRPSDAVDTITRDITDYPDALGRKVQFGNTRDPNRTFTNRGIEFLRVDDATALTGGTYE